jgi:hypothetical protein
LQYIFLELIAKSAQDKNKADVMPNKLSEINPVNDLTDSVRGNEEKLS